MTRLVDGPGHHGRIFVSNEMVMDGYTTGDGSTMVEGLIATGDVGYLDTHGRLFVAGRDDDMIVSGGENVFPREVEDLLADHPEVDDAAVIGVPDDEFGERLRAFVVRAAGATLTEQEVKELRPRNLARFKVPARRRVRRRAAAQRDRQGAQAGPARRADGAHRPLRSRRACGSRPGEGRRLSSRSRRTRSSWPASATSRAGAGPRHARRRTHGRRRLRAAAALRGDGRGPCMRCLEPAAPSVVVDAREVEVPGRREELDSPYVDGERARPAPLGPRRRRAGDAGAGAVRSATARDCARTAPSPLAARRPRPPSRARRRTPAGPQLRELKLD